MDRQHVIAVVAGSVAMLAAGFLLYGVLFAWMFAEGALRLPGVMRTSLGIGWILLGQLGFGVLLVLVLSWRGSQTLRAGAQTGAILGFLMAVGYDFAQYGTTHLWTLEATLLDPFVAGLQVAVGGAAAGFILDRKS